MSSVSDRASQFRSADAGFFGSDDQRIKHLAYQYTGADRPLLATERFHFNVLTTYNTLGGWNGTDQFTVPFTGNYRISAICGNVAGTAAYAQLWVDPISGAPDIPLGSAHLAATVGTGSITTVRNFTAGDIVFVIASAPCTQGGDAAVGPTSAFAVELLSRA